MDLTTRYLGLELQSPLVASASPLSQGLEAIREMSDSGLGAIVMFSVFEEQLRREQLRNDQMLDATSEVSGEAGSYFPQTSAAASEHPGQRYLNLVERAVAVSRVPVIPSINGATPGWWPHYATQLAEAGAAAIELNVYTVPGDPATTGGDIEQRHLDILAAVKESVRIPVAVKVSPYFSSTGNMLQRLDAAGADGLVLFNRFVQPDIDVDSMSVLPTIVLSRAYDSLLPQTWIALLRGRVSASLAASGGVETSEQVVKYLLAGADVVMTTSALLRHGPGYGRQLLDGLVAWMTRTGVDSPAQMRGRLAAEANDGRAGYVAALRQAQRTYSTR